MGDSLEILVRGRGAGERPGKIDEVERDRLLVAWMSNEIGRLSIELNERRASLLEMNLACLLTCGFFAGWLWWTGEVSYYAITLFVFPNLVGVVMGGVKRARLHERLRRERESDWDGRVPRLAPG